MNRRRFLATFGPVGLAGCARLPDDPASGAPTGTASPVGTTNRPSGTPSSTVSETSVHPGYDEVEVRATTKGGTVLGTVTAAIADTRELRYLGLSDTRSLPADRGMLFVYDGVDDRTFVMREMDFGIDIVYADDEGTITRIHHAPEPGPDEDGSNQRYPGRGQYVLEVNYDWTTDHDVAEGDLLDFDL